jgi:hypothetical protein
MRGNALGRWGTSWLFFTRRCCPQSKRPQRKPAEAKEIKYDSAGKVSFFSSWQSALTLGFNEVQSSYWPPSDFRAWSIWDLNEAKVRYLIVF